MEQFLVVIALFCVPVMLFGKPYFLHKAHKQKTLNVVQVKWTFVVVLEYRGTDFGYYCVTLRSSYACCETSRFALSTQSHDTLGIVRIIIFLRLSVNIITF